MQSRLAEIEHLSRELTQKVRQQRVENGISLPTPTVHAAAAPGQPAAGPSLLVLQALLTAAFSPNLARGRAACPARVLEEISRNRLEPRCTVYFVVAQARRGTLSFACACRGTLCFACAGLHLLCATAECACTCTSACACAWHCARRCAHGVWRVHAMPSWRVQRSVLAWYRAPRPYSSCTCKCTYTCPQDKDSAAGVHLTQDHLAAALAPCGELKQVGLGAAARRAVR